MLAQETSGLRILVADDQRVNQLILESFLRKEGHTVIVAANGAEAIDLFRAEKPDLVLMDIRMPVVDGLDAARAINQDAGPLRPPIIFLTAVTDQETMIEGLHLADDFIGKPIDLSVLRAKLRATIRLVQSQRLLRSQARRIERLNDAMHQESEIAAYVLGRVLAHTEQPDGDFLNYRVVPSAMFSGDMVLARRTPAGRLHLLLADAVGHGLPAAINILPLFFPFDGMSRKGCTIGTIARELNRRVRDLLPGDRFVATTLVSIDVGHGDLEIWNGGNPPALVFDADGNICSRVDSMQMALGLNDDDAALFVPRRVQCGVGEQLLICSDGIWENPAFAGERPEWRIMDVLGGRPPQQQLELLIQTAIDAGQTDDLSAVIVTGSAGGGARPAGAQRRGKHGQGAGSRLSLQFGPGTLGQADTVAAVLDMAESLALVEQFPDLPAVLQELFANALDYGVLELDGRHKYRSAADYLAYDALRRERLALLEEGFVMVDIEPDFLDGQRVLRLNVADSGMGFDWAACLATSAPPDAPEAGLGLQLAKRLAARLGFNRQGSEAIALIAPRAVASPSRAEDAS